MMAHRFAQFEAPDEPEPAAPAGTEPLVVDAGIFFQGGDDKLYPIREGMVLTSNDNYVIYVKPETVCHLYIYQVDATGTVFKLFPNTDFSPTINPLAAGQAV